MATNEPMTDDMLDAINALLHDSRGGIPDLWLAHLFDEVCRARAREQALEAENEQKQAQIDAMRPMVEALATGSVIATGSANTRITGPVLFNAFADMPALHERARAFIAAHPTAGDPDAYDEVESEGE